MTDNGVGEVFNFVMGANDEQQVGPYKVYTHTYREGPTYDCGCGIEIGEEPMGFIMRALSHVPIIKDHVGPRLITTVIRCKAHRFTIKEAE